MPSRLSSLLVRDGLVGVRRMEKAFQRQVIYGGSLDTILLELGMVPEERLCQYLALASGLPPASRTEIEQIDAGAVALLPLESAQAYRAIPLALEGEALRMAVCAPIDLAALEDLADQIDRPLRPLLVPEYRWHLMLAVAYGASVPQRFAQLAAQIEKDPASQPVGRARTIIVENEPERDTIVAATPTLPPGPPVTPAQEEAVRARSQRVTEDVAPLIPRAVASAELARGSGATGAERPVSGRRPPSQSEGSAGRPPPPPGAAEPRGELSVDAPKLPDRGATVQLAQHDDTPRAAKQRRRGVTLIGVTPLKALGELGPQGDLLSDADLSPASGIPQHVRGELGDDDVTPPPRRVSEERRRATATEMMFPAPAATTSGTARYAAQAAPAPDPDADTAIADVEEPTPLPPAPPAPARSKTAPMPAVQVATTGSQPVPVLGQRAPTAPIAPIADAATGAAPPSRPSSPSTSPATSPAVPHDVAAAPTRPARRITENPAIVPPARAATAPLPRQRTASQPPSSAALDSLRGAPSFATAAAPPPANGPLSIRDARELLAHAEHRDEVFLALLRAVRHVAQWAGLLTVQGGVAIGRLALAHPELDTEQISTVLIPLDAPSPIRTAMTSKRLYVGPLAKGDPAVDSMFLRMGGVRPPSLAVLPLVLRERVVALVAAHRADREISFGDVSELLPLAALATEAIGKLILRSKTESKGDSRGGRPSSSPLGDVGSGRTSMAARSRSDTTPDELMPHRGAPSQSAELRAGRGERSQTEPDPEDPEPEPARPRPVLEIIADDGDHEVGELSDDDPTAEAAVPRGWIGGGETAPGYGRSASRQRGRVSEAPWRARATSEPSPWAKEAKQRQSQPLPTMPGDAGPAPAAAIPSSSGAAPVALTPEVLIELIEQRDPAAMEPAIDEAIARTAEVLPVIAQRFPGLLGVDRYNVTGRPLRAAQYGGLLELITRMGAGVTSLLLDKMSAPSRDARFYAAVCLLELRPKSAIPALFDHLFDPDFGVRACCVEALQGYPSRDLDGGLRRVRQALHHQDPNRVAAAAAAAAELADLDALVDLIGGLGRGERFAEPCRRALMALTKQDFGLAEGRWMKWWDDHRRRHRVEWLIDGLAHKEPELRASAIADLRRLTGESFGYEPEAAKREREIAHRRWLSWWAEAGRLRFLVGDNERHRPTALLPPRRD